MTYQWILNIHQMVVSCLPWGNDKWKSSSIDFGMLGHFANPWKKKFSCKASIYQSLEEIVKNTYQDHVELVVIPYVNFNPMINKRNIHKRKHKSKAVIPYMCAMMNIIAFFFFFFMTYYVAKSNQAFSKDENVCMYIEDARNSLCLQELSVWSIVIVA